MAALAGQSTGHRILDHWGIRPGGAKQPRAYKQSRPREKARDLRMSKLEPGTEFVSTSLHPIELTGESTLGDEKTTAGEAGSPELS